jgi:uncharacterized protein
MNMKLRGFQLVLVLFSMFLYPATNSMSAEYEAMQGVESANAVFDFRVGDPDAALGHLNLIHTMMDDQNMILNGEQPEIVVVFIGPSVNLVSTNGSQSSQEKEQLTAIADKIATMDKDGIVFEICMTAAHAHDVDPDSILPEINKVGNGLISVIGYQHNGYALVANF